MSGFAKLTRADGPPLWIRRDQVAALTVYKGNTVVVTATDDVDYEVKETPEQVLSLLAEDGPDGSLTFTNQCGIISGRRKDYAQGHRKDKRKIPAGGREAPAAVPPVVHDAASLL